MKTNLIGSLFLFLSLILLFCFFQIFHESRQLEKKINLINKKIFITQETNQVLLSEYAAHTNPNYISQISNIYLDYEQNNKERILIYSKNTFINKINSLNSFIPVVSKNDKKRISFTQDN